MQEKKAICNMPRRRFLIQTPVAAVGLLTLMNTSAGASLQTGNYRRRIDTDVCVACGACAEVCPTGAIHEYNSTYVVNANLCIGCEACDPVCPVEAIEQGSLIIVPTVYSDDCVACGACVSECPTNAISVGSYAVINANLCSGCRDCVDVCPTAAIG